MKAFFRRKVHKHAPHYHVVTDPSTDRVLLHTVHDEERFPTRDLGSHFSAEMPLADPEPPAHHLVRDDHEDATLIVRTVNRRYGCYPGYAYGEAPLGKPHDTHLDFDQNPLPQEKDHVYDPSKSVFIDSYNPDMARPGFNTHRYAKVIRDRAQVVFSNNNVRDPTAYGWIPDTPVMNQARRQMPSALMQDGVQTRPYSELETQDDSEPLHYLPIGRMNPTPLLFGIQLTF